MSFIQNILYLNFKFYRLTVSAHLFDDFLGSSWISSETLEMKHTSTLYIWSSKVQFIKLKTGSNNFQIWSYWHENKIIVLIDITRINRTSLRSYHRFYILSWQGNIVHWEGRVVIFSSCTFWLIFISSPHRNGKITCFILVLMIKKSCIDMYINWQWLSCNYQKHHWPIIFSKLPGIHLWSVHRDN